MTTAVLTSEAMAHKKANGEKLGGDCPYGFTVAADGKTLLPDSAEQRLIAQVRSARARGLSQRAVVAYLTEQGFTTRKGTAFSLIQVQRIMRQAQSSPPASHTHERTPMPYTPTGRPTGRPKTKEYDTLMARVPRDFAEQVKRYAARHRQSISELIRDGLVWRIEQDTPGRPWSTCIGMPIDPDDLSVPCNGDTGIQELSPRVYEAIAAAVREAIAPVMGIPITEHHESVIQQPVPVLQQDTVSRDGAEALASEGYDASKFSLGKLCPKGHRYGDSGLSLLRKHHGGCRECENQAKREKRARQKAAQAQER
jgi:hypothetical protein